MDFGLISSVFETFRITPPPKLTLLEAQSLVIRALSSLPA